MGAESDRRYAPHGLVVSLYTSRDRQLSFDDYRKELNGALGKYKSELSEHLCRMSGLPVEGPRARPVRGYLKDLYKPHHFVTFGRFDCGHIVLVDDFEVLPRITGPASAMAEKFETAHIAEQPTGSHLLWRKRDIAGALNRRPCVAISRLKVHVMFVSVLGYDIYRYICDMASAILKAEHPDVDVVMGEALGGPDMVMVVCANSFRELGQVVADIRERSFESLYRKLPAPAGRRRYQELVRQYGDSEIGRKIKRSSKELRDGLPRRNHLFLSTSTVVGYRLDIHKHIHDSIAYRGKERGRRADAKVRGETPHWGKIAVQSRGSIKPGHLALAQRKLAKSGGRLFKKAGRPGRDDIVFYFGETDLIASEREPVGDGGAAGKRGSLLVPALDYVKFFLRKRKTLDPLLRGPDARLRLREWKPSVTSDFYALYTDVGVAINRRLVGKPRQSREVAPFVEVLHHSLGISGEERRDSDILHQLRLPSPYVHGLEAVLKTFRMFMRDAFVVDWMFEIEEYVEALRQYLKDVAKGGNRYRVAHQLGEAVAIFERAFLHRMRAGMRTAQLADYSMEFKGMLVRPLSSIQALLESILAVSAKTSPNAARIKKGALAVLVADPSPEVVPIVSANCRCMGVMLSSLAILRPECLGDLFHEGGHTLRYDGIWRDWCRWENGDRRIDQVRRSILKIAAPISREDSVRVSTLYLSLGRECAAEMLRLAVGCWGDWDLYARVFMSEFHALSLESYTAQESPKSHLELMRDDPHMAPSPVAQLTNSCVMLLCIRAIAIPGEPDVHSRRFVTDVLGHVAGYCPELRDIYRDRRSDKDAADFFRHLKDCFVAAHDILQPTLSRLWDSIQTAMRQLRGDDLDEKPAMCRKALEDGRPVTSGEGEMFPAILYKAMLESSYARLNPECVYLPRADVLGGIKYSLVRDARKRVGGKYTGVFLDRKLGGVFLATPQSRAEYFRRRAALITSLWDWQARRKQTRLLSLVDRLMKSTNTKDTHKGRRCSTARKGR